MRIYVRKGARSTPSTTTTPTAPPETFLGMKIVVSPELPPGWFGLESNSMWVFSNGAYLLKVHKNMKGYPVLHLTQIEKAS